MSGTTGSNAVETPRFFAVVSTHRHASTPTPDQRSGVDAVIVGGTHPGLSVRLVGHADGTALARWNLRMSTRKTIGIGEFHELAIRGWRRRRMFRKSNHADDQQVDHDGKDEPGCLLRLHVSLIFPFSQADIRPA